MPGDQLRGLGDEQLSAQAYYQRLYSGRRLRRPAEDAGAAAGTVPAVGPVLLCLRPHHGAYLPADGGPDAAGPVRQIAGPAPAVLRHPPVRRPDEPLYQRHGHRVGDDQLQLRQCGVLRLDVYRHCCYDAVYELGADADHLCLSGADAAGGQGRGRQKPRELSGTAAGAGRHERLYRGDGGGPEGHQGVQPREQGHRAVLRAERQLSGRRHGGPDLLRRHDAGHGQPVTHRLRRHLLRGRTAGHRRDVRCGLAGRVPAVCEAGEPAHLADQPAGERAAGGGGRRGAHLRRHGGRAGGG